MSVVNELLEYQNVDKKLREIEQEISASEERKKYLQAKKFMESAREKLAAQDKHAAALRALRDDLIRRAEDISKQIAEYADVDEMVEEGGDVLFYKKNAQVLLDRLRAVKGELQKLTADVNAAVEEYERYMKQGSAMQKQYKEYNEKYKELKNSRAAEVQTIGKQLEKLAAAVREKNAGVMEKYIAKRRDGIFPVLVPLTNDRCVCGMDFPLAQQGKLADGNVVECENCHRFVYKA